MPTADEEKAKYEAVWSHEAYRKHSPGLSVLSQAYEWLQPEAGSSFTDFGCGAGVVCDALMARGHKATAVDIAPGAYRGMAPFVEACLWNLPWNLPVSDYGYCADVMEHIPTERVDDVLLQIAGKVRIGAYFQIALFHDSFGALIGQPLHLSVFPDEWWQARLTRAFRQCQFRATGQYLHAVVRK